MLFIRYYPLLSYILPLEIDNFELYRHRIYFIVVQLLLLFFVNILIENKCFYINKYGAELWGTAKPSIINPI